MKSGSSVAYFDSSALVKLVVDEDWSEAVRSGLGSWPRRATSRISVVEVIRAVQRRGETAIPLARAVLARVSLVEIGDRVLIGAAFVDAPALRSVDAIHLSSALALGERLDAFVSYDLRQLEAAAALGLPVASPR